MEVLANIYSRVDINVHIVQICITLCRIQSTQYILI